MASPVSFIHISITWDTVLPVRMRPDLKTQEGSLTGEKEEQAETRQKGRLQLDRAHPAQTSVGPRPQCWDFVNNGETEGVSENFENGWLVHSG